MKDNGEEKKITAITNDSKDENNLDNVHRFTSQILFPCRFYIVSRTFWLQLTLSLTVGSVRQMGLFVEELMSLITLILHEVHINFCMSFLSNRFVPPNLLLIMLISVLLFLKAMFMFLLYLKNIFLKLVDSCYMFVNVIYI